jgi:hypothetical protein
MLGPMCRTEYCSYWKVFCSVTVGEYTWGRWENERVQYISETVRDAADCGEGPISSLREHGNEPSASIKGRIFLVKLNNHVPHQQPLSHV